MIICDTDNIATEPGRPSPEAIADQWRKQTEALKLLRRRLQEVSGRKIIRFIQASA